MHSMCSILKQGASQQTDSARSLYRSSLLKSRDLGQMETKVIANFHFVHLATLRYYVRENRGLAFAIAVIEGLGEAR